MCHLRMRRKIECMKRVKGNECLYDMGSILRNHKPFRQRLNRETLLDCVILHTP